jgi:phosphoribosylaminoimidazole-succinocarboxamide synthase
MAPTTRTSYRRHVALIGRGLAEQVRHSVAHMRLRSSTAQRGIIIADTKFEFGVEAGRLTLIDEALTRIRRASAADTYRPGTSPPSFDKQYVRDYLETVDGRSARRRRNCRPKSSHGRARSTRKPCAASPAEPGRSCHARSR